MSDDEKMRWLVAAGANSQVRSEGFKAGPFYQKALRTLKPLLTHQWLFDHDKSGVLHNPEENPVAHNDAAEDT